MNLTTLKTAQNLTSSGWDKFKDYRDKKSHQALEVLENAAETVDKSAEKHFPATRREAGKLTKHAHARLERALESLDETGRELGSDAADKASELRDSADKRARELRKNAQKSKFKGKVKAKKARLRGRAKLSRAERKAQAEAQKVKNNAAKKANKKKAKQLAKKAKSHKSQGRGFGFYALIIAIVAAIGGAVYYFVKSRKPAVHAQPPHTSDFKNDNQSRTLVYSSTTEDDMGADTKAAGDLAEDPAERDEELLADIDSQLAGNRTEAADENLAASEATRAVHNDDAVAADNAARIDDVLKEDEDNDSQKNS